MSRRSIFSTLESRIYIIITTMLFIAIFIMQLVFFKFVTNNIITSTLDNNKTLLKQLVTQIDSYINEVENISRIISQDKEIQNYLENPNSSTTKKKLSNRLYNYKQARTDISNILVYGKNDTVLLGDPDSKINLWTEIKKSSWYIDAIYKNGESAVSTSYVQNIIVDNYTWVVSLSREIFSDKSGESLGVVLVDLKFNQIDELCKSLITGKKGYDFIVDEKGNYIYHPTQQLLNSNLRSEPVDHLLKLIYNDNEYYLNGEKYYIAETSKLTGWSVIGVTHNSDIITNWKNVQIIYTLLGLVLFLFVGPIAKAVSSGITKPVRKLQAIMRTVENGEFNLIGHLDATEEIQNLAFDYDIMVGKIQELIETNIKDQELKRKSDLIALQAQINPHFLYNTLDSIIWMGEMGQNDKVVKMTSALSKLFRISISKGNELIRIADEVAHVRSYLTIQEMRYKEKFDYNINIDPEIFNFSIIKITLQPLVENAIYHGIKGIDSKGEITITSRMEMGIISLCVEDNGQGMSNEKVDELIDSLDIVNNDLNILKSGIGLRNVHQRIRLYFGDEYGLSIRSQVGKGTTITATIPAIDRESRI